MNGTDPSHIRYLDSQSLRDHLIYCLETKTFTLFPSVDYDEDDDVVHAQSIVHTPVPKKAPTKKKVGKTTSKPKKPSEYLPALTDSLPKVGNRQKQISTFTHFCFLELLPRTNIDVGVTASFAATRCLNKE